MPPKDPVVQCTGLLVRVSKRIGNTIASMWERLGEHSSHGPRNTGGHAVFHLWCHNTYTWMGDHTAMERVQLPYRKDDQTTSGIKESIYIRMLHLDHNVDRRRLHLPPIWDNLLDVSCDLKAQSHWG